MGFTELSHAFIAAKYYVYLKEIFGDRGEAAFLHATRYYGEQRGRRMAQRAIRDGKPLTYETYCQYGEWVNTEEVKAQGLGNQSETTSLSPDFQIHIHVCPWHTQFKNMGLPEAGLLYCKDLDASISRGFNPEIRYASQIRSIGDLAKTDLTRVQKLVGVKMGKLIHDYANGMDSSPVLAEPEAVKGYGNSVTLEEDVTDTAQANKILLALCDSVASRMRADGRRCSCVTVTIRGNDFRNKSHQRKLPAPTDVTAEVFALSKTLFSELWDGYTPLRLLGVTLGDISDNETVQLSMFQDDQKDRARKLDQTVDQLRSKFGVTAISRGSVTDATKRVGRKYKAQLEEDKPK